jgi:hypothetical protein
VTLDAILKTEKTNIGGGSNGTQNNIIPSSLSSSNSSSLISFDEVELSVIGMTDTGLVPGFTYSANPQRINMSNDGSSNTTQIQTNRTYNSKIKLVLEEDKIEKSRQNRYNAMIKSSTLEESEQQQQQLEHPLFVSLLFPIPVLLDLPSSTIPNQQQASDKESTSNSNDFDNQSPSFFDTREYQSYQ